MKEWAGTAARLVTGVVWIWAGALKLPHPEQSVLAVRAYQLLPGDSATTVGHLLPVLEIVVGTCLVLGLLTASSATGQLVFLPILAHLAVTYGWRTVSLTVAGATLLLVPLVMLLLRDRPSDLGLPRYGETAVQPRPVLTENPARRALRGLGMGLRSKDFWLLGGTFFICGASTNGLIGTHLIPACFDHGIPEVTAAGLLALLTGIPLRSAENFMPHPGEQSGPFLGV